MRKPNIRNSRRTALEEARLYNEASSHTVFCSNTEKHESIISVKHAFSETSQTTQTYVLHYDPYYLFKVKYLNVFSTHLDVPFSLFCRRTQELL